MQFRDLQKQYEVLKPKMDAAMGAVAASARFISGPQVKELEDRLAHWVGRKHCVSCANGTDALQLCLLAWASAPGTPYSCRISPSSPPVRWPPP